MAHYTYLDHLIEGADWQKLALAVAVGGGLVLLGRGLTARLTSDDGVNRAIIPAERPSLFGFFDLFVETFVNFHDSILGRENRSSIPITFSLFLFLLAANMIGLIPGMPAITTSVWINVGIALVVFVYFNFRGIVANGVLGYLKHFAGPILILAPLIFCLEILSTLLRIVTLNLRLYWNITADHRVLEAFMDLAGQYLVPVVFYAMGTFVSFMQAFVFTILTMIYILLATQHEEDDHGH